LSLLLEWGRSYRGTPQPAQCTPGAGAFEGLCTPLVQTKGPKANISDDEQVLIVYLGYYIQLVSFSGFLF